MDIFAATILACFCSIWTMGRLGSCLRCYTCTNSKIVSKSGSSSGILQKLTGKIEDNPGCSETDLFRGSTTTSPCDNGEVCGNVRATVTFSEKITNGEITVETVGRGCMPNPSSSTYGALETCLPGTNAVKTAINVYFQIFNSVPFTDVEVDGDVCYCYTDLCSAGRCATDSFKILAYCVKIWYVGLAAGALLLLISSCICCCCCCCGGCCCRKPGKVQAYPQAYPPGGYEMQVQPGSQVNQGYVYSQNYQKA